jgi:hypothetical protein
MEDTLRAEGGPWKVRFETAEDRGRRRYYGTPKTREFSAVLVAFTTANGFWSSGQHDPLRPVHAVFAVTRGGEVPFTANLRAGRKLRVEGLGSSSGDKGHPMEFLKSAEYEVRSQRLDHGVVLDVFLRDLFECAPAMTNDEEVLFVVSESEDRLRREAAAFDPAGLDVVLDRFHRREGEDIRAFERRIGESPLGLTRDFDLVKVRRSVVLAEGRRFAAAIDRRADIPILADPLFGVQLLCSALAHKFATRSTHYAPFSPSTGGNFCEVGMDRTGRAPGLAFRRRQDDLEAWLASEVAAYDALRSRRLARGRR